MANFEGTQSYHQLDLEQEETLRNLQLGESVDLTFGWILSPDSGTSLLKSQVERDLKEVNPALRITKQEFSESEFGGLNVTYTITLETATQDETMYDS